MMAEAKSKSNPSPGDEPIPKAVVNRLSLYLRELQHPREAPRETISSQELGRRLGFTDAQVRKDLAHFGQFGYPGVGYRCSELIQAIRKILGTDRDWTIAMVGVGNLGRALLGYRGFSRQGFRIVAAFDVDARTIDQQIEGVRVYSLERLDEIVRDERIRLGLIAVPLPAAQGVADRLVAAGVQGILNFAPMALTLPNTVSQIGVDLAMELEQLTFAVAQRELAAE